MTNPERAIRLCFLATLFLLSACSVHKSQDAPPVSASSPLELPDDAVPRDEPKSRYGNGPVYEVLGNTYRVLDTSNGYQERGVASWYGKKFHGRRTSNQERYDMYAMTAAHKSLPLPSYVRVRNLRNNKSVVVRVNDRGPFVDNRLIDLSYSAARKLDMIKDGTSLVEVTAINYDKNVAKPAKPIIAQDVIAQPGSSLFVQVGAFGEMINARRRFALLRSNGIDKAFVHEDLSRQATMYRVKIGPIADVLQYDSIVARLQGLGISETHLVTE